MAEDRTGGGGSRGTEHVTVGRVIRPHGIRGALLVEAFSEVIHALRPQSVVYLGPEKRRAVVVAFRPHRKRFLLRLEGYEDRTSAEALRGLDIHLAFEDAPPLPEGVYYYWQILDCEVLTEEGEVLGRVAEIIETGANDVYLVRSERGEELLLPAIEQVIRQVDLERRRLIVRLLPGLRDE